MSALVNFNGQYIEREIPLIGADSRGLKYGDGIFETMKVAGGKILLGNLHFERLLSGIRLLQLSFSTAVDAGYFEEQILATVEKNRMSGTARVRLMVFRGNGSVHDTDGTGNFIIDCSPLPEADDEWPAGGIHLGVFPGARKSCDALSALKSNNYLPYAMAALYAKHHGFGDCLLLNSHERVCESTISNVFWVKGEVIYTPPLSEGCVAGVMRRHLLESLPAAGYKTEQQPVTVEQLQNAEEIFLTNAVSILRSVEVFNGIYLENKVIRRIVASIFNL